MEKRLGFGSYLARAVAMATLSTFSGLKFMGIPQPEPIHRFSPNIKDMFNLKDLEIIMF